ncbi:hypothetical protein MMC16_000657 [Acarospora aff. strigata]|nr:hypothetical protein [Acarospora aff. strigata]
MEEDPFDSVLNLEDQFYDDGYQLGVADGSRAGRIEGRVFGLEKGFEKYLAMGILHGRAAVWAGRLPNIRERQATKTQSPRPADEPQPNMSNLEDQSILRKSEDRQDSATEKTPGSSLPTVPDNPRLEKHVQTLYALVEAASLSTENTEDAVSDFDDRFKRGSAKAKIIERLVGEAIHRHDDTSTVDVRSTGKHNKNEQNTKGDGDGSIEDISSLQARH